VRTNRSNYNSERGRMGKEVGVERHGFAKRNGIGAPAPRFQKIYSPFGEADCKRKRPSQKSWLRRSYVAVIEAGEHFRAKTLQKLAKAFGVDVTELLA